MLSTQLQRLDNEVKNLCTSGVSSLEERLEEVCSTTQRVFHPVWSRDHCSDVTISKFRFSIDFDSIFSPK